MAIPKVFISSTCFDLGEIRDQLQKFVRSFGFDPILSEYGDVFYHPDLHTHESCVNEISNCQLFILIIGGRFGGQYISDKTKSITNAEYDAARKQKIPIFTYVKNGVLGSHHVYKQNKDNAFVAEIQYPGIEKNEYALEIFRFIDEVRRAPSNNSIESFEKFVDIEIHLRKQWAALIFDFLKSREVRQQIDATNHLLNGLSASSNKLEELVKSLYREVSTTSAEDTITSIDINSKTEEFFTEIFEINDEALTPSYLPTGMSLDTIAEVDPKKLTWYEYLLKTKIFENDKEDSNKDIAISIYTNDYHYTFDENDDDDIPVKKLFTEGLVHSTKEQRLRALNKILSTKQSDRKN